MASDLRKTGISVVGSVPWGTHLCLFYESSQDLVDTLVPYFKAGLERNEFCLCTVDRDVVKQDVTRSLTQAVPDLARYIANRAIEIVQSKKFYLDEGSFDAVKTTRYWHEKLEHALAAGFAGMRANGDEAWLEHKYWPDFSEYERALGDAIGGSRLLVLCAYPLETSRPDQVLDVAQAHEYVIAKRGEDWELLETAALRQTKQELKALSGELERRVAQRTTQLEATNDQLTTEITQRKHVEEELVEKEARYRRLFETSHDVILFLNAAGDILDINPRGAQITGFTQDELRHMNGFRDLIVPADHANIRKVLEQVQKGQAQRYQVRWKTKDGRIVYFDGITVPRVSVDGNFLSTFCSLRDITHRHEQQEKIAYLSHYDSLTGLPNRELFRERITHLLNSARRGGQQVAIVVGDVLRFRRINETVGRDAGDTVLREGALRLKEVWPEPETLARFAGASFAGAISQASEPAAIIHSLDKVTQEAFRAPFVVAGHELRMGFTSGIAVFPNDGDDADSLLTNAEAALLRAKAQRERFLFYQPQMNAHVAQLLALENNLQRAFEQDQFILHYQPKISSATGRVTSLEALMRWQDPKVGLVPPAQFIRVLEETGLILEVGRWAIRKALVDARRWRSADGEPLRVAVNVSAIQLQQRDFVEAVGAAITELDGRSCPLDLEITESLVMHDIQENIQKLTALSNMGVRLSIDDFGTGYSSLAYMAQLPVHDLKIDRSFVAGMARSAQSMTIVGTIVSLAHSLGVTVTAEGVETEEQAELLTGMGCDQLQGYLYSRPLAADDLTEFLRKHAEQTSEY
jgi:diguanylate cyclase (GGDEF)-like protein/PAS domain S-box-containing protein